MKKQYRMWTAAILFGLLMTVMATACSRKDGGPQQGSSQTQESVQNGAGQENGSPEGGGTESEAAGKGSSGNGFGGQQENSLAAELKTGYRTGLGVIHRMQDSGDAEDANGTALVFGYAAAVVLDEQDKIVNCVVDEVEASMEFTQDGRLAQPAGTEFPSKKELLSEDERLPENEALPGNERMSSGDEWLAKAAALEESVLGKTMEELSDGDGMEAGEYIEAIVKACNAASYIGTGEGDELGLGIVTDMEKSKDAAEGNDGQCQAYSYYVVTTMDQDGRMTGVILDAAQPTVTFDSDGKITSDLQAEVKTKKELGDSYGMKAASGIGKEWYEQAEAMEAYARGKTLKELEGIAVTEEGKTEEMDLISSVTISIADFQKGFRKATERVMGRGAAAQETKAQEAAEQEGT